MNPKEEKKIIAAIKAGASGIDTLIEYYIRNSNIWELAQRCAYQALAEPEEPAQITINQDELDRIISLFKVRGLRSGSDGNYVRETRGRKSKSSVSPETI